MFTGGALYLEEDLFYTPGNQDRNYTGGGGIRLQGRWVEKSLYPVQRPFDRLLGIPERVAETRHGFLLSLTAFTPDSLNTRDPIHDDRPYSSLLAVSTDRVAARGREAWATQLSIGVLGLRVAERAQRGIHCWGGRPCETERPYDPIGWRNQISDGGEPTALYRATYLRLLTESPRGGDGQKAVNVQTSARAGGSIGYYTGLDAGLTTRVGWIQTPFWAFTNTPLGSVNQRVDDGGATDKRYELFWYGSLRPRLVAYNALLQGQFRDSRVVIPATNLERFVTEFDTGISVGMLTPKVNASLTWVVIAGRTPEFLGPRERVHTWASVFLSLGPGSGGGGGR